MDKTGTLYIVATPIGNLEDITIRAINTLKSVDIIACEDTRHSKILLDKYGIKKYLVSFYSYNQVRKTDYLMAQLKTGKNVAIVSDSGTPGISDPGYIMIKSAIDSNIEVETIPGPTALISALVVSGKPTNKFIFEGFLSNKSSQRKKRLSELKGNGYTLVIYESPHRILSFLQDIIDVLGDVEIACMRELTKKFQQIKRGKVSEILEYYSKNKPKGEFVVII